MTEVKKKCWPEFFELLLSGRKNAELRLADFDLKAGDTLILEEWDPKTKKYTGRKLSKRVKAVHKVDVTRMHSPDEIKKNGLYLIEMV
jgi:ASC-1-like (ASCH) protein